MRCAGQGLRSLGRAVRARLRTAAGRCLDGSADSVDAPARRHPSKSGCTNSVCSILWITLRARRFRHGESIAFIGPGLRPSCCAGSRCCAHPNPSDEIMTITLARGAVRCRVEGPTVKSMPSIHDLGAINVLCTGQTGHPHRGAHRDDEHVDMAGNDGARSDARLAEQAVSRAAESPLDEAIFRHARRSTRRRGGRSTNSLPTSNVASVSVLVERDGARTLIIKGAPEDVIRLCTSAETPDGATQVLTDRLRAALRAELRSVERPEAFGCSVSPAVRSTRIRRRPY